MRCKISENGIPVNIERRNSESTPVKTINNPSLDYAREVLSMIHPDASANKEQRPIHHNKSYTTVKSVNGRRTMKKKGKQIHTTISVGGIPVKIEPNSMKCKNFLSARINNPTLEKARAIIKKINY